MNKILFLFIFVDIQFVAFGGFILGYAILSKQAMSTPPTVDNVAKNLLITGTPLDAAIANNIFIIISFLASLPALVLITNRFWLKFHGWLLVFSALFTLVVGLTIWFQTLTTRSELSVSWGKQTPEVQSLLQEKFECCGYFNSTAPPFQQDETCPNPQAAAQKPGCLGSFYSFANDYLRVIFTALFGFVALDFILLICGAMVLKDRREQERYRHIDSKNGVGSI